MKKLTIEQALRIFHLHYGAPLAWLSDDLKSVDSVYRGEEAAFKFDDAIRHVKMLPLEELQFRLFLTPITQMRDEDAISVAKILDEDYANETAEARAEFIEALFTETPGYLINAYGVPDYIGIGDFLRQRGYAIPVFIEPEHPDNGKTAIELGLAVDSTISIPGNEQ